MMQQTGQPAAKRPKENTNIQNFKHESYAKSFKLRKAGNFYAFRYTV